MWYLLSRRQRRVADVPGFDKIVMPSKEVGHRQAWCSARVGCGRLHTWLS